MTGCEAYRQRLLLSLRGDLDAAEQELLSQHLTGCSACRADLAELHNVYALTGVVDEESCLDTDQLLSNTMRAIVNGGDAARAARPSRLHRAGEWLVIAASLALLLFGAVFTVRQVMNADLRSNGLIALEKPDFELPEISLRKIDFAVHAEEDRKIHWVDDFETARSLAKYSSAPILYQVYDERCPIAKRVEGECFNDNQIVSASRDYICIRRTHGQHALATQPDISPAFYVIDPDGDVVKLFGGDIDTDQLLEELANAAQLTGCVRLREFEKNRETLEEALDAYRRRSFCGVQEKLDCFACACKGCCMKTSGISEEYERIDAAMQSYIDAKHTFARDLVGNGEIERARAFYRTILEEFKGLSVEAALRAELEELTGGSE